jgi:hypothetical protein
MVETNVKSNIGPGVHAQHEAMRRFESILKLAALARGGNSSPRSNGSACRSRNGVNAPAAAQRQLLGSRGMRRRGW